MKKGFYKRVYAVILALAMILSGLPVFEHQSVKAAPGDTIRSADCPDLSFVELSDSEVAVYSYSPESPDTSVTNLEITVPETITYDGTVYTVIGISNYSFNYGYPELIAKVNLPETITYIGTSAFASCINLESINLPDAIIEIGDDAFVGCKKLSSVTLPASLEKIGNEAFSECKGLKGVLKLPKGLKTIGSRAFNEDYGISGIEFESGSELESIGDYAFYNDLNLTGTIELPNNELEIGEFAFYGASITDLVIPEKIKEIKTNAFSSTRPPKTITNNSENYISFSDIIQNFSYEYKIGGITVDKIKATDGKAERSRIINSYEYVYDGFIFQILTETPVRTAAITAIDADRSRQNVVIPETVNDGTYDYIVTKIGTDAFLNENLTGTLTLPDTLEIIGQNAFCYNVNLSGDLNLSGLSKLSSIEYGAFSYTGFKGKLTLPSGGSSYKIGDSAFAYTDFSNKLIIPDTVTELGVEAFSNTCFETVDINGSFTEIPRFCFNNCSSLKAVTMSDNINVINEYAFADCIGLTSTGLSTNLTKISGYAFCGCSSLMDINIPTGLLYIGDNAFANCCKLETAILPEGLTTLGGYAFSGCKGLTEIKLPNAIKVVSDGAFDDCDNLKKIEFAPDTTEIGEYSFASCDGLENTVLPDSIKKLGDYAFHNCLSIKSITIPNCIESIGEYAFYACYDLDCDLILPETLTDIGQYAFGNLSEMKHKIELPKSIKTIGEGVFVDTGSGASLIVDEGFAPTTMSADSFAQFCPNYIENNSDTNLNVEIPDIEGQSTYVKETETAGKKTYVKATDTGKGKYYLTKDITDYSFKLKDETTKLVYKADESPVEPEILVYNSEDNTTLVEGLDYIVEYENNTKYAPYETPTYTVVGINKYYGRTYPELFDIYSDISDETLYTIKEIVDMEYTGSNIEIYDYDLLKYTKLNSYIYPGDILIEYSDNVNAGTATIKITGNETSGFIGERTVTFKINKADPLYTIPSDPGFACNDTIADISSYLDSIYDNAGKFSIVDADQVLVEGYNTIKLKFTPDDTANYNELTDLLWDVSIPAHSEGDWEIQTEATATTAGTKVKKCTVCGKVLDTENIPATGPSGGSGWGNSGGTSGGSSGGTSGGSSGGTSGGSSGGTSGGSSGGTSGGSSGGTSGGSSGGTSSGSSGGTSGGSSGGTSGGSSGGTSGGSSGGSSGTTTPTPTVTPKPTVTPTPTATPAPIKVGSSVKDTKGKATYVVTSVNTKAPEVKYTADNSSAKKVTVPAAVTIDGVKYKVTAVAANAFKNNKNITSVTISSGVTTIGKNAFKGCTKLKTVTIGSKVTSIKEGAFSGCKALKTLTIGKNVKSIGKNAFAGCDALEKLVIKTNALTTKTIAKGAFKAIPASCKVYISKEAGSSYPTLLQSKGLSKAIKVLTSKKF